MADCYVNVFLDDEKLKKVEEVGLAGEVKDVEGKKAIQVVMTQKDKKKLQKGFQDLTFDDSDTCVLPENGEQTLLNIILEMKSVDVMKFAITKLYNPACWKRCVWKRHRYALKGEIMDAGCYTAIITPFTNSATAVDYTSLEKLVDFQITNGITGILAVGTTGESPTLAWEEHHKVTQTIAEQTRGKCLCIAGTGSNNTKESYRRNGACRRCGRRCGAFGGSVLQRTQLPGDTKGIHSPDCRKIS